MGTRYLIDTNIAIYFLEGVLPSQSLAFLQDVLDNECNLSIISKIELLSWQFPTPHKASITELFVQNTTVFPLSEDVVNSTIDMRKNFKIKIPDAIIAATALVYDFTLVTRNEKDFAAIFGLSLYNPFNDSKAV